MIMMMMMMMMMTMMVMVMMVMMEGGTIAATLIEVARQKRGSWPSLSVIKYKTLKIQIQNFKTQQHSLDLLRWRWGLHWAREQLH